MLAYQCSEQDAPRGEDNLVDIAHRAGEEPGLQVARNIATGGRRDA